MIRTDCASFCGNGIGMAADRADFVAGYLSDHNAVPRSADVSSIETPISAKTARGGRASPFYLAHSYHTKIPPEAITPFIEHYTRPGDIVLDPFCGSGMTGVAAAMAGRRAILNDLSPAAVHLAWNHTRTCDPDDLAAAFAKIYAKLAPTFRDLYATTDATGRLALIHWTLWSTEHACPKCGGRFLLWDAMDRAGGRLGREITCPRCGETSPRTRLTLLGSQPAWIAYEDADGKRAEKAPTDAESAIAAAHSRSDIEAWFPDTLVGKDREMYRRCALQLHGIETVADFYTARNLRALALIWREIESVGDDRVKRALAFAFTNTAWHGTRMRRFNARGGQRPLTGTLYVPQLSSEANVLEVMRNKIAQLRRYYAAFRPAEQMPPAIFLGSATRLTGVADASIDYVFTDPPFGSNIFYADCNLIWESWLGRETDATREAVINRSTTQSKGGKSLADYTDAMTGSMREIARVLKPGGWATVVFHNTDAKVWTAIRDAASAAGFEFHEAASLDRAQKSHKGYKGDASGEDVAHFDVIFNLRKPVAGQPSRIQHRKASSLADEVNRALSNPAIASRGLQGVHAEVMRRMASIEGANFVDYAIVRETYQAAVSTNETNTGIYGFTSPDSTLLSE